MKRIVFTATTLILIFALCACGGDGNSGTTTNPSELIQTTTSKPTQGQDSSGSLPTESDSPQMLSVEQAMDLLYEGYIDAELSHPGELDKWEGNTLFYCFVYDDGDNAIRYAYVNASTGEVEMVDEIEDYTGAGGDSGDTDVPSWWGEYMGDEFSLGITNFNGTSFRFTFSNLRNGQPFFEGVAALYPNDDFMAEFGEVTFSLFDGSSSIDVYAPESSEWAQLSGHYDQAGDGEY